MFKNKALDIEIVFKTYLKLLKTDFCFIKYHKTIFKNYFKKLLSNKILIFYIKIYLKF